jgi:hypothetical protein
MWLPLTNRSQRTRRKHTDPSWINRWHARKPATNTRQFKPSKCSVNSHHALVVMHRDLNIDNATCYQVWERQLELYAKCSTIGRTKGSWRIDAIPVLLTWCHNTVEAMGLCWIWGSVTSPTPIWSRPTCTWLFCCTVRIQVSTEYHHVVTSP